jgi:hypothetical protein
VLRVLLLNATVTVDSVTGVRALTFSERSIIPGIERAGDLVDVANIELAWGPSLRAGEPAALYIAADSMMGLRLSLFVNGRRRWTSTTSELLSEHIGQATACMTRPSGTGTATPGLWPWLTTSF